MSKNWGGIAVLASIAIIVAGCTGSDEPLLDGQPAVTPLPDRFVAEEPHRWFMKGPPTMHVVRRDGDVYRGTDPDGRVTDYTLFDVGLPHELLVVQAKIQDGRAFYGFMRLEGEQELRFHMLRTFRLWQRLEDAGIAPEYVTDRGEYVRLSSTADLLVALDIAAEAFDPEDLRSVVTLMPADGSGAAPVAAAPSLQSDGADASVAEIIALLQAGNRVAVTPRTTLIMGGFVDRLTSSCDSLGLSAADGAALVGFATTAALQATFGGNYRDVDIGESLSAAALLGGAGDLAHRTVGCGPGAPRLLQGVAASVRAGGDEESVFVASCREHLGLQRCSCLQKEARSIMGNLANQQYTRQILPTIAQANPFAAIRIGMVCGISNY